MPRIFDVVEYFDRTGREFVHRVPEQGSGDFRLGSQLIVRESQRAVFFRDGKALDTFQPGRHTLSTANLPLLASIVGAAFGGETPFKAEVYFVNMREFVEQKWGTLQPIALRDSDLGMVQLRAFGTFSMQVNDAQLFVNKIVGTQDLYNTSDIQDFLRSIIVSKLTDLLGEIQKSLFDLPSMYDEISAGARSRIREDFDNLGLALKSLYVSNISPTEEAQKAIDERAAMGAIGNMQAYLQFKAARALGDAAQAGGEGAAGGLAGAGMGLGAGAGMGAMMAKMMSEAMAGQSGQQQTASPTITCPSCSTEIAAHSKFCNQCGAKIGGDLICPNCQTDLPEGSKFCHNCGTKIE